MKIKNTAVILQLLLISCFSMTVKSQNMYKWEKVNIPNVLSFRIPPSMEMRDSDGFIKKVLDEYVERVFEKQFNPSRVVIQTKGFGEIEYLATMLYGRIIVEFDFDDYSDFANQVALFNQDDLDEITYMDSQELKEESTKYGIILKEISKTTLKKIGNKKALHYSYIRESVRDKSDVKVDVFRVFTNNYIAKITYSYRVSEAKIWKDDLEKSVETFQFK